jgi:hypothetical protein
VDQRALNRVSLIAGLLIAIASLVTIRRYHTDETGVQFLLVAGLAIGGCLFIVGLVNMLMEPPVTPEEEDEALAEAEVRRGRPVSIATAVGVYLLALSAIAAVVVGIALNDVGAGIQTFTFGLILGGVIWGLGVLLGYRPVEEESQR